VIAVSYPWPMDPQSIGHSRSPLSLMNPHWPKLGWCQGVSSDDIVKVTNIIYTGSHTLF
jgi:hypothetical protein